MKKLNENTTELVILPDESVAESENATAELWIRMSWGTQGLLQVHQNTDQKNTEGKILASLKSMTKLQLISVEPRFHPRGNKHRLQVVDQHQQLKSPLQKKIFFFRTSGHVTRKPFRNSSC